MSSIHRTIKVFLYPNPMKNAKGKYLARTFKHTTYNIQDICELIERKSGTGAKAETLKHHANLIFNEIIEQVLDGKKVDCGYFTAQANVKGSFDSLGDRFDKERHSVDIVFSEGHLSHKAKKELSVNVIDTKPNSFRIWTISDRQTNLRTDKLVMNRVLVIRGEKIKITGDNPTVGLYLLHNETGKEIHFPSTALLSNGDTTLELIVPELAAGSYQLKITTQYSGNGKPLVKPRSYQYEHDLYAE